MTIGFLPEAWMIMEPWAGTPSGPVKKRIQTIKIRTCLMIVMTRKSIPIWKKLPPAEIDTSDVQVGTHFLQVPASDSATFALDIRGVNLWLRSIQSEVLLVCSLNCVWAINKSSMPPCSVKGRSDAKQSIGMTLESVRQRIMEEQTSVCWEFQICKFFLRFDDLIDNFPSFGQGNSWNLFHDDEPRPYGVLH